MVKYDFFLQFLWNSVSSHLWLIIMVWIKLWKMNRARLLARGLILWLFRAIFLADPTDAQHTEITHLWSLKSTSPIAACYYFPQILVMTPIQGSHDNAWITKACLSLLHQSLSLLNNALPPWSSYFDELSSNLELHRSFSIPLEIISDVEAFGPTTQVTIKKLFSLSIMPARSCEPLMAPFVTVPVAS